MLHSQRAGKFPVKAAYSSLVQRDDWAGTIFGVEFGKDCTMCRDIQETIIHTLCDCSVVAKVSNRPDEIVSKAECFVSNIHESLISSGSLGVNQGIKVKWHPPSSGWVKINVNGSTNMNGHCLMVVGAVRDSTGNWLEGFRKYIGRGSALKFELWAILTSLEVA
ncbi:hypothetical protein GOBAR_AA34809 [Gossypium barbadense]|uniref:RNase H type-1 domain-containing protein n=1 Tax=Gossypium barbadense TaxID=3634 RepID=A0A2P5W482_GOSBA|nr:hypothetical protein GOBAR_AA34809 [Gossypium barbadense]